MSFRETIIEYFADQVRRELPDRIVREQSAHDLKNLYAVLKQRSEHRVLSRPQKIVYGVTRLAGTLAVMQEIFALFSHHKLSPPQTILDCGSGPGTALLAAYEVFGRAPQYTGIEQDAGFIAMAERAVRDLLPEAHDHFRFIKGTVPLEKIDEAFDLTIFSYMLSEISPAKLDAVLDWALRHTKHYLIITDAGTPHVYRHLMAARQRIIEQGFTILAPCPHHDPCPLVAPDFCHFPARFARHAEARRLKDANASAEDEKYCYLIARSPHCSEQPFTHARVIAKPLKRSGHTILDLCVHDGSKKRLTISKKHDTYRAAKNASWGDEFTTG